MSLSIPCIKEGVNTYDIYTKLMEHRIIFIDSEIDDSLSSNIIAQLLYLDAIGDNDITMYINSPGGVVTSGLAMCDIMGKIKSEIKTICFGQAASMATVLMACGTKGKRYSLESSRIMIHQPMGGAYGQCSDIEIGCNEIRRMKDLIYSIMSEKTGKSIKQIEKDCDRDNFMSPEEAVKYGLIDKVI